MTHAQQNRYLQRQAYLRRKPGTAQYRRHKTAQRRIRELIRRYPEIVR